LLRVGPATASMLCLALSWASSEQVSFQRQLPESYVGIDSLTLAVTLTNTGTTPLNITPVTTTLRTLAALGAVYFVWLGLERLRLGNFLRGRSVCE